MKIEATQRHHSFHVDKVWDMEGQGYTDPTYIETKIVSHKSDIYSFGIVMFELLCGRKAVINDDQDNKYLAPMAILHYREEKLEDIVEWNISKQIDPQSFKVFTEIAYDCLNEEPSQRPNIDDIVPKLEKALKFARQNRPKGKLAPRYVGPFEILERIGPIAYQLRLFEELSGIHDTFHMSNLKKCLADSSLHMLLDEIKVDKTLRFVEEPVEIMDREIKSLKRSKISLVKVRWNSKRDPEFTWERKDYMKSKYP
ncbi:putative reverse transcriptase domain-containing protein [Tanacetum coccineum]